MSATPASVEQDLMARLARHRALGHAPTSEHAWLVTHGTLMTYEAGVVIMRKGERVESLFVLFEGHIVIRADRGAGAHTVFEWRGGDIGGAVPYSRGASPPADSVVEERAEMLMLPKETFPELTRECPVTTAALVHAMLDRARMFTSSDLRDEKLISLGKLSSGLAHELNNPASAVVRSAKRLAGVLNASEESARRLGAMPLSVEQLAAIDTVRALCVTPPPLESLSAVARSDREESIADWLRAHGADDGSAGPLAETGVTLAALEALAAAVGRDTLDAALRWLAAGCQVRALSAEIEAAGSRIYDLVAAVKGFSYMDRAPAAEPVDIRRGIADTLTMLGAKMRAKSVQVSVEVANELPRARAVGAELNQVWMNLIDNAIDAVAVGGHVTVSAAPDLDCVSVRIIDDGPGIPPEIAGRIFDPFFTTKGVGKGTGLGLDIVRRLLKSNAGAIAVESVPGRTEFQVRLPAVR
jgi:signal transduction histidine kinase